MGAAFRDQVGLPPKLLARILRFDRVVARLRTQDPERWADVAYDAGYYDQAHFNRDFRELAGTTPSAFLASRLPDGGGFAG
jgi:methylphosphotriester-DNA--protein-cysteine methyltransferase